MRKIKGDNMDQEQETNCKKSTTKESFKAEIDWRILKSIADYYQFPYAVFLINKPLKGTRAASIRGRLEECKMKLIKIIDSLY